ncbi:MAG: hypothetical protein ACKVOU_10035 [Cytophagales bacterium]
MKKYPFMVRLSNIFSILVLLFFASCEYSAYPTRNSDDDFRLTKIPTPEHDKNVKLYFQNETIRDTNYIKVGIIEAYSQENLDDNALLKSIQKQGQEYGVDAVVILGFDNDSYSLKSGNSRIYTLGRSTYISENTQNVREKRIKGLGIKFLKNVDYANDYIKYKECFVYDTLAREYKKIGQIDYDFEGNKLEFKGDRKQYNHYKRYSSTYLLEAEINWGFRYNEDRTAIIRKHFTDWTNQIWDVRCYVETEKSNCSCYKKIVITRKTEGKNVKELLTTKSDTLKFETEWLFTEKGISTWKHIVSTDTNHIPTKEEIYNLKYGADLPIYKEIYTRYTIGDFLKILTDEGY